MPNSYRKAAYDPAKDADNLEIEYRTRDEIATGIEPAPTSAKFAVFPNPATDQFSFNVEGKVMDVKIIDLTGRLVKRELQPAGNSVNVSSIQKGVYTVSITSAKNTYTSRLIIK